jgi:hypothetical protein
MCWSSKPFTLLVVLVLLPGRQYRVAPSRDIYWIITQFERTGSVCVINVRRDASSFVPHLHEVRYLRAHHTENVLLQKTNFASV